MFRIRQFWFLGYGLRQYQVRLCFQPAWSIIRKKELQASITGKIVGKSLSVITHQQYTWTSLSFRRIATVSLLDGSCLWTLDRVTFYWTCQSWVETEGCLSLKSLKCYLKSHIGGKSFLGQKINRIVEVQRFNGQSIEQWFTLWCLGKITMIMYCGNTISMRYWAQKFLLGCSR